MKSSWWFEMGEFDRVGVWLEKAFGYLFWGGGNGTEDFGGFYSYVRLALVSEIHEGISLWVAIRRS
jgi:hypothetical protein